MVEIQPFLGNYELWNKLQIKTFLRTLWHGIQTQGKGKMAKDGWITNHKILIKVLYCVCVCYVNVEWFQLCVCILELCQIKAFYFYTKSIPVTQIDLS